MKDKDLLKLLLYNGWRVKRISGSHYILSKDGLIETFPCMEKMLRQDF